MSAVPIEYYTYDDYIHWEGRWELIEGIPYAMSPSPMRTHQNIAYEIARFVGNKIQEKGCEECEVLGEFDYKISSDTVLRPDVVLVCNETNERYLTKAPEIIFEVISPNTAKRDEVYKFELYQFERVKYYVIVYPDDLKAKIFKLNGSKYEKEGDFTIESYHFRDIECELEMDFEKIFRRYRKKLNGK